MTGTEDAPIGQRMILNANQGVTNIIEHDVIRRDMARVTDAIFDKLKDHYGPYSSFAGLDANKPLEDTVFTKDGANIIKSIEFASPLEDWVRRAVSYIGTNMEKAAGDGTTSSMMFACGMLKHMNATIENMKPINYNLFCDAWKMFLRDVREYQKKYILNAKQGEEYKPEKVYELAWLQTYTSSHGNTELADAVADMFKRTPPGLWAQMTFKRRRYEHTKLFEIQESQFQYECEADILSKAIYNKDNGRYLEYEKATFIVINGRIELDNMYWKDIQTLIEKSTKENPVVIFALSDYDNATFGKLMEYTSKKEQYCFAVFGKKPDHPRINDLTNLQAITGANVTEYTGGEFSGKPCIVQDVHVKYEFEKLSLDHLYTDTREKVDFIRERPYYSDSSKPYYREFADTILKFIEAYESADMSREQQRELKSFRDMYNKLVYDKSICLVIGGHTFDNLAMYDVVDDVIRATIRSLENGVVISNNKTLYVVVNEIITHYENQKRMHADFSKREELQLWFAQCVRKTLNTFADVVLDQLYPRGKDTVEGFIPKMGFLSRIWHPTTWFGYDDPIKTSMHLPDYYDPEMEVLERKIACRFDEDERRSFCSWWFDHSVNMLNYNNRVLWDKQLPHTMTSTKHYIRRQYDKRSMIVQPSNADIVMLERFGEIALKFILTERVIVSGSAYLNKKETKK